jgi:transcriptional regulator GlxA family with amidase domain
MAEQWLRIIHGYVNRFASPVDHDPRMWKTWEMVAERLDHPWSIRVLAKEACLSEKQFQRLCKKELGRSPQQQLMWLRIRKAAEMLAAGEKKIQSIALAVGYHNPFVFSSTFKRMIGWSPSEYSRRRIDSLQNLDHGQPYDAK